MKPKKCDKSEVNIKVNKSVNLRNESKVKPKVIQSSDRVCNRCKCHQIYAAIKGHNPCPFNDCNCDKCIKYIAKKCALNEKNKRRLEKIKKNKSKSQINDNSVINSLKVNAKKILNKSGKKSKNGNTSYNKKRSRNKGSVDCSQQRVSINKPKRRTPPKLIAQQPIDMNVPEMVATNEELIRETDEIIPEIMVDTNDLAPNDSQPKPEESSPLLCTQYFRAAIELSQKLKSYNMKDYELLSALKYFAIRNCLGDVDKAAQSVLISAQEVNKGALFAIHGHNSVEISDPIQQTVQSLGSSRGVNPMLCSTFNRNVRPNGAPNYCPDFTPIRRN